MSATTGEQRRVLHIVAVPFQQEGHINGMLRLAQYLAAQEDVVVTFGYPARFFHLAHKRHKSTALTPTTTAASLLVHVLEDGLPRQEEQNLTPPMVLASIPIFQQSVKLLLDDLFLKSGLPPVFGTPAATVASYLDAEQLRLPPPSCIISDTFMPWTQDLANAARIPRVDLWTSTAAVYAMGSQLPRLVSNGTLPLPKRCWLDVKSKWTARAPLIDCVPGLPPFPPTDMPTQFVHAEQVTDLELQFMVAAFSRVREAHNILIHSLYELESPIFDALEAIGLPVKAVGPLPEGGPPPPAVYKEDFAVPPLPIKHSCLLWLDSQPPSSVIYIALGTIAKLSPPELHVLALALEASRHPFLWVIRPDSIPCALSDALPDPGFLHRTVDQGSALIIPWAPQTQVLSHPSTAAFFSHCGWNSTLESMCEGVPMVACPRGAEQRSNARWIVEHWKFGVELERKDDGSFTREAVEKALRDVAGVQGAKEKDGSVDYYRERALHAKELARRAFERDGTSRANVVKFMQDLRSIP